MAKKKPHHIIKLPATGSPLALDYERYLPDMCGLIHYEHLHRYMLAAKFAEGKTVLDIACGEGYGTYILSQVAKSVIGVDISKETIAAAKEKYPKDNITFIESDATAIPLDDSSVEVLVSFETIEHLEDHDAFFREVKRVLKDDGIAFISSPNKYVFSAINGMTNKFHITEITLDEFKVLINRWFKKVRIMKQQVFGASHLTGGIRSKLPVYFEKNEYSEILQYYEIENPLYSLAVVTDGKLPEIPNSFYLDTVSKHNGIHYYQMEASIYSNVIRDLNKQLTALNQRHEATLAQKDAELAQSRQEYETLLADRDQVISQKDAELSQLHEEHEAAIARKDAELAQSRQEYETLLADRDQVVSQKDAELSQLHEEHEAAIARKDAELTQSRQEYETLLADRDQVISQKDAELSQLHEEHEEAIARKDAELTQSRQEYETLLADRDQVISQKDAELSQLHEEHEEAIARKDAELTQSRQEYETLLADRDQVVSQKDAELSQLHEEHEAAIARKDAELTQSRQEYETLLADRDQVISQKDAELSQLHEEHEEAIAWKDADLAQSRQEYETLLADRDQVISQKDAELSQLHEEHEEAIAWKDADLAQSRQEYETLLADRDQVISQKDAELSQLHEEHETAFARQDADLAQSRQEYETLLADRDQVVSQKDAELSQLHEEHETAFARKDADLTQSRQEYETLLAVLSQLHVKHDAVLVKKNVELAQSRHEYETLFHHIVAFPARSRIRKVLHRLNIKKWFFLRMGRSLLAASSMFDKDYYLEKYPDVKNAGIEPIKHYLLYGWRELRDPSLSFSTRQYLIDHPDVASTGMNPLLHYLRHGHIEGRAVSEVHSSVPKPEAGAEPELPSSESDTPSDDHTFNMKVIPVTPVSKKEVKTVRNSIFFNEAYYRNTYADLAASGMDMARHYCEHGWREGRDSSVLFDTMYYLESNSDIQNAGINPLYHYIIAGRGEGRAPSRLHNCDYEDDCRFGTIDTDIKPIAFYLPQFHEIPENNEWWGEGFTDWENTRKAKPLIQGHYQPREPHDDFGYYDLSDWRVLKHQAEMAKAHGIYGFCFYHYWFAGKRLLEKPVDMLLDHPEIDLPFCLCWANENWTRRWDGFDDDILMEQHHSAANDIAFIDDLMKYLEDDRYIRIDGKPVILLYRPGILPDAKKTVDRFRKRLIENGAGEVYLLCSFGAFDDTTPPKDYGFDAAFEFPPNVLEPNQRHFQSIFLEGYEGNVYKYEQFVADVLSKRELDKGKNIKLFYSVMLEWDNAPRREKGATIL